MTLTHDLIRSVVAKGPAKFPAHILVGIIQRFSHDIKLGILIPEFCTQIAFNEVRGQVAAIDLGDDCYSKIQVSIFSKYFLA